MASEIEGREEPVWRQDQRRRTRSLDQVLL